MFVTLEPKDLTDQPQALTLNYDWREDGLTAVAVSLLDELLAAINRKTIPVRCASRRTINLPNLDGVFAPFCGKSNAGEWFCLSYENSRGVA